MIQLSKPPRNKPGIYKADLTAGSLKLPESRIVADLLLRNVGPEEWKRAIYSENVLQSKTPETSRRLASLLAVLQRQARGLRVTCLLHRYHEGRLARMHTEDVIPL